MVHVLNMFLVSVLFVGTALQPALARCQCSLYAPVPLESGGVLNVDLQVRRKEEAVRWCIDDVNNEALWTDEMMAWWIGEILSWGDEVARFWDDE